MVAPGVDSLSTLALHLFVAFDIGALIGLEREQSDSGGLFAGSRTFPLLALYGAIVQAFFPSLLYVGLAGVALAIVVAYAGKIWVEGDVGLTTVMAALLTVVLGALTTHSATGRVVALVVGGVVVAILSAKGRIHRFANRIEDEERRATVKFILVVMVVYPLLPDRELAALLGLNPRYVWLMVVFVSALSFVAYALSRVVGARRGIAVTGILGGFVSSTATTVSMATRATESPDLSRMCAVSTVVAASVMFPRALIEIAVVNRSLLGLVVVPLGAMTAVGGLGAGVLYLRTSSPEAVTSEVDNPFRLGPALLFGGIFAVVLLVSEYASVWLGSTGVYATAFISGLADVDSMTLTLATLEAQGQIAPGVATGGIVIAAISNTFVKVGLAWVLGTRRLGRLVTAILGIVVLVGTGIVLVS
jgi:uncharacterized membrane protein (DUF4010 family)